MTKAVGRLLRAVPQFAVADVARTAAYYRDVLGFEIAGYWDGAGTSAAALHLHPVGATMPACAAGRHRSAGRAAPTCPDDERARNLPRAECADDGR
jgi:catechol 2,3-dioxygenase-like lactoylglutathione lyase family enzyme